MAIQKQLFGSLEGSDITRYTITNNRGNSVSVINYGATVVSWKIKDSNGRMRDVITGFSDMAGYLSHNAYFGCIVGRYANRIARGRFELDGEMYQLACNIGNNHLHGGLKGFNNKIWQAEIIDEMTPGLLLSYESPDGEEGYPGNLSIKVEYRYSDDDVLEINYYAETDRNTHINLTNHCYFNLTGDMRRNILDHKLQINAHAYTEVNDELIPTGTFVPVDHTVYDFRTAKPVGHELEKTDNGFDLNFVLTATDDGLTPVAVLTGPDNELQLSVFTTEPGLQLYTGNFLDGTFINKDGVPVGMHAALCLETQHFPDSPNQPHFPPTLLEPGKSFVSKTSYKINSLVQQ